MAEAIGPFDRQDAIGYAHLFQTQLLGGGSLQPVQVRVIERQPSAFVLVHQREGGAADLSGIDAQPRGKAAHERRLPCAKISCQQHDITGPESSGELARQGRGFFFRTGDVRHGYLAARKGSLYVCSSSRVVR